MKITELTKLIRLGGYEITRRMNEILSIFFEYVFEVPVERTGGAVAFDKDAVYGSGAAFVTGNITHDLEGARLGVEISIFHSDAGGPTYPDGWKLLGGTYADAGNNLITARYYSDDVIGYTIENWT